MLDQQLLEYLRLLGDIFDRLLAVQPQGDKAGLDDFGFIIFHIHRVQKSLFEPGRDIDIVFTGLREGEKLYEELLNQRENTIRTHHEKIMIAKVREYDFSTVKKNIFELITLFNGQDNMAIVTKMKEIVPEYVSNNSEFEKLDR